MKYVSSSAQSGDCRAIGLASMRATYALLVLCFALTAPSGWAAEARTSMLVSATVEARATVETVGSTAGVTVTHADLKRGFVDVTRTYRLRSNTAQTLLQLHPRIGLTRQIDVAGLPSPLQIEETSVEVMHPAKSQLRLQYRLWLHPEAAAGKYPLPVHLVALAI